MICPGWIRNSRKAQIALGAVASVVILAALQSLGVPGEVVDRVSRDLTILGSIWMGSIALEDASKKNSAPQSGDRGAGSEPSELSGNDKPVGNAGPRA